MTLHRLMDVIRGNVNRLPRIDEVPYLLTFPVVYLAAKLRIHPNSLALVSFLCSLVVVGGVWLGWQITNPVTLIILLLIRVLLDCADGQLARYSGKTSTLGALYDLGGDFLFVTLFFAAIGYSIVRFEQVAPLTAMVLVPSAYVSTVVTSTTASFFSRLSHQTQHSVEQVKDQFISRFANERPHDRWYTIKMNFLNTFFYISWRAVSLVIFKCLIRSSDVRNRKVAAHITAFFEFGIHWITLSVLLWIWQSLIIFLVYEILAFCLFIVLILLLTGTQSSDV